MLGSGKDSPDRVAHETRGIMNVQANLTDRHEEIVGQLSLHHVAPRPSPEGLTA